MARKPKNTAQTVNTPSAVEYDKLKLNQFASGLCTDFPSTIPDNALAVATNVEFSPEGRPYPRHGLLKRYASDFDPSPVLGMAPFYKSDGTSRLVMAAGTTIYTDTPHLVFNYATQAQWQAAGVYTDCDTAPTAGYETGASGGSTNISGGTANQFQIACDADVDASTYHNVTLTLTGLTTGALIAAQMQTQIRAIGGIYANVTVAYTNSVYVTTSGTTGSDSKVRIIAGTSNDVSATLKIGAANGAVDTDGQSSAVYMFTPPTPTFSRSSVAYDDYGVSYASGVPRYPYMPLAGPVFSDLFTSNDISNYTSGGDAVATWAITPGSPNGTLSGTGGTQATLLVNNLSFQNVDIVANCSQAGNARLVARLQDNNNYYFMGISDSVGTNVIWINKRVAGTVTALGSVAINFPSGTKFPIKFTVHGSVLEAWFNGVKMISLTDTSITTAGSVGFGNSSTESAIFESFSVYYAQQGVEVEEGTTNLLTANQSHPTSTTGFTNDSGVTISVDSTQGWLSGTPSSLKIVTPGGSWVGAGTAQQAATAGNTYTATVRLTGSGYVNLVLRAKNSSNGIISQQAVGVYLNGTWQLAVVTYTMPTGTAYMDMQVQANTAVTYWWDGAQLVQSSYATSWITGASTRAAETLTVPTANVFTKGSWAVELVYRPKDALPSTYFWVWETQIDSQNSYQLYVDSSGALHLAVVSGNTSYTISSSNGFIVLGSVYAIAVSGDGTNIRLCCNGSQIGSDTSYVEPVGTLPTSMYIGGNPQGSGQADGLISDFRVSSRARTAAEHTAYFDSGLPQAWDIDTTTLLSFAGNLNQPAIRQSVWQSPVQNASTASSDASLIVTWQDIIPANTAISCQVRTSPDGSTWSMWYSQINGQYAAAPANLYSQIRFILQETDGISSPVVTTATAFYDNAPSVSVGKSGMAVASRYSFCQLANYLVIVNGVDIPQQYDGTTVSAISAAPQGAVAVTYKNYVFIAHTGANTSRLYFSDLVNPQSWPATNFIDINPNDGDSIQALIPLPTTLLIVKQHNIYMLQGYGPSTFSVINAGPGGTVAQNGFLWTPYGMFYTDDEGVWTTDLRKQLKLTIPIQGVWNLVSSAYLSGAAMYYWQEKILIAVPYNGSNGNSMVLVYDLRLRSWSTIPDWNANCFCTFFERTAWKYLMGSSVSGNVFEIGGQTNDAGTAFTAEIQTKHFPLVSEEVIKRLKWVDLYFGQGAAAVTVGVQFIVDGVASAQKTFTVPAGTGEMSVFRVWPPAYGSTVAIDVQFQGASFNAATFLGFTLTFYPRMTRPTRVI